MNREAPSRHEQFPLLERNVWHWQRYEGYKKKHTSAISVRYDTKGRANAKKKKKKKEKKNLSSMFCNGDNYRQLCGELL